jgi:hypothetical protein
MDSRSKLEKSVNLELNKKISDAIFKPKKVNKRGEVFYLVAKTLNNDHNFEIYTHFDTQYGIIYFVIYCLNPVEKEKMNFCLKLLNVCNEFERQGRYALVPNDHFISCTTVHNSSQTKHAIVNELVSTAECSVDCILYLYDAVEKNDTSAFKGWALQHGYYDL